MSKTRQATSLTLAPADNRRLAELCGQFDENLRTIERQLGVEINNRGHEFHIIGPKRSVGQAKEVLQKLYTETEQPKQFDNEILYSIIQPEKNRQSLDSNQQAKYDEVTIRTQQRIIRARSKNQYIYLKNILEHDICFGVGPSGTGKTYMAVACAVQALENDHVRRIVLVRPAVEAGEKLGFLPGDLAEKVNPYLRPIIDALYEMIGSERTMKLIENDVIEVAPLAFMRGRNLNDSFIILDESQNTTREQMKMFLTRIGFGSKAVITGDITQVDLPKGTDCGLRHAIEVLEDVDEISFTFFKSFDVVRHPLVQKIVNAYDEHDDASNT